MGLLNKIFNKNSEVENSILKCEKHYISISTEPVMDHAYICDEYYTNDKWFKCKYRIEWKYNEDEMRKNFHVYQNLMDLVYDKDDMQYTILGPRSSLNLNQYIEPLQWVVDNLENFEVEFSVYKFKNKLKVPGKEWGMKVRVGFDDMDRFSAFKLRYHDTLNDLCMTR